jgi:DNA-binding NtrC family response regulator
LKHYIWNQSKQGWLMVRVLVVDDEELIRDVLTQWLQSWGYEAVAVARADEALEHMRTSPADIIIADAAMPEHDSLWLLNRVREQWPNTLVIMESGADDLETALRTRLHGAFDHVPKPLAHETLHQALERARTAIQPPSNLNGQPAPPGGSKPPTES